MLLVLWDIDGTLMHSGGHGGRAFEDAFRTVVGREPVPVEYGGRTDQQIALAMLDGEREHLPRILEELASAMDARRDDIRRDGHAYPGVAAVLEELHGREGVIQSLLTGNIQSNAALKVSAFGLERWLDLEVGAYGSDPHERRSDLVAVAEARATRKYAAEHQRGAGGASPRMASVLVGDTPHDVQAAREAGARAVAVMTGFAERGAVERSQPDALLDDLSDTAAAVAAITAT